MNAIPFFRKMITFDTDNFGTGFGTSETVA